MIADRFYRAYGLDPRMTEVPTVRELIRFQALEEYESENDARETILPGYAWRLPEGRSENYLCEIADLLRVVASALGAGIDESDLGRFGPVRGRLPRVKSADELKRERIENENRLFGKVADGVIGAHGGCGTFDSRTE